MRLTCVLFLLVASCIMRKPGVGPAASSGDRASAVGPARAASGSANFAAARATDLVGPADLRAFQVHGDVKKVAVTEVPVEGQPFAQALRIEVKEASGSDWSVQLQARTAAPLQKGDVALATFHLRTLKPQEGSVAAETEFVFENAGEPYTKSVTYPVKFGAEWRKIQVRFVVEEAYAAGGAQMIFRLGFEPEVFELGGVTVQGYGTQLSRWDLPSSEQADHRADVALARAAPVAAPLPVVDGGGLDFQVDPDKTVGPISPYVYGINSQNLDKLNTTLRRMGGNRQTVYNWELNASNAGSDYNHVNDDWPCTTLGYDICHEPGAQMTSFVAENKKAGVESMLTIPMADWASADKKGPVDENEAPPSRRFVRSVTRKNAPYALIPDLNDGTVYQDEFVAFLVKKLGRADQGGVRFYSLDNEPALWSSTHPRIHPKHVTYAEITARTEATAAAITEIDPSATVLGAVAFGWSEYMSLQSAADAKEENAKLGPGGNYLDYFLQSMKRLEAKHKRRLVHVLDVHWYPEPKGTKRITEKDSSPKTVAVRLEATRSLWDPTYVEKSWIADALHGKPIRLIPWLRETIARNYPGTKLSLTEYNYGAGEHISGGLAQADVLGIFGREGVYLANYWGNGAGVGDMPGYVAGAFKLYRNYDGNGGTFGDTSVTANIADLAKGSIYAATDTKRRGLLTILVINKSQQANYHARIKIAGATKYGQARAFALGGGAPDVKPLGTVAVNNNEITHSLPALSATLFVCEKR
ncbi:MAG: glycoside hydrolase family 44 protein [Bacteroidota bacterium]